MLTNDLTKGKFFIELDNRDDNHCFCFFCLIKKSWDSSITPNSLIPMQ